MARVLLAGGIVLFPGNAARAAESRTEAQGAPRTMWVARMVEAGKPLEVLQVPVPVPGPTDAIVRVEVSGICRTDWHMWHEGNRISHDPLVLGHEVAGVVDMVGEKVRSIKPGDRVTVPANQGCGVCPMCKAGLQNRCPKSRVFGGPGEGGWAEFTRVVNANMNCVKLPDDIDMLTGAALACRYGTAYRAVVDRGQVRPGQWVAVFGAGAVGLSAVQVASAIGANVIAVDITDEKLELAKRQGAVAVVNARTSKDVPVEVRSLSDGGVSVSIEAVGLPETVSNGIQSLRPGGRYVQVGKVPGGPTGSVPIPVNLLIRNELQIVGSQGFPNGRYTELFELIRRGKLNPKALISRQVGLDEVNGVLNDMTTYQTIGYCVITRFHPAKAQDNPVR